MLSLLAALALAQDTPSAARLCADAAAGEEIDVCVALAAEHPDEVDGIAAALRAHVDRAEADDRALLGAILALLSDEEAIDGAARLATLGDPRAVRPLARAARTREVDVAVAAVEAMAAYSESLEPLTGWLLDRDVPIEVRVAAAHALGALGDDTGADAMIAALRRTGVPAPVRDALDASIRTWFPERVPELDAAVRRDGGVWEAAGTGLALGQALGTAGHFGRANLTAFGVGTGVAAGATTGWIMGRTWPMEAADATFFATSTGAGVASGALIGHALPPWSRRDDGLWLGGLAGNALGTGLGLGLGRAHRGNVADVVEGSLFGVATATAAGTLTEFVWRNQTGAWDWGPAPRVRYAQLASGIGLAAGTAVGHAIAPAVDITTRDVLFIGLTSAYGMTAAIVAPVRGRRYGLPAAGLAIGAIAGTGLAAVVEPTPDSVVGGATGLAYGSALGAGLGMLADRSDRTDGAAPRGFALAGATVGLGTGAFVAYRNPEFLDPADLVFVSLVTGWAGWQSLGWYEVADRPFPERGWFVVVPAAIGTLAAATTPLVDVPIAYSFSSLSLGLWGTFLGSATGRLVGGDTADRLAWSLVGSDIGLAAGLLAAAPPLSAPPLVIAIADAGGVLGASIFALSSSFVTDDATHILLAGVVGTGLGFTGGAILGSALHRSGRARDIAMPTVPLPGGEWTVAPAVVRAANEVGYGVQVRVRGW